MTEFERKRINSIRESATGKITTVCFVIDLSGSMLLSDEVNIGGGRTGTRSRIDRINDTIKLFHNKLMEERDYRNLDICVIGYNEKPKIYNKFTFCDDFKPAELRVEKNGQAGSGKGDTGTAIKYALKLLDNRKEEYIEAYGLSPKKMHRPWLIVFSDGRPTCNDGDKAANNRMKEAAKMVNVREENNQIHPIPVFIGTTSEDGISRQKGIDAMDSLSLQKGRYIDIDGDNISLDDFISTLAKSISSNAAALLDKHRSGNIRNANSIPAADQQREFVVQKEQPVEVEQAEEQPVEEEVEVNAYEIIKVYIRTEADVASRRESPDSIPAPSIHSKPAVKEEDKPQPIEQPKPAIKEAPKVEQPKAKVEFDENDDGEPEEQPEPVVKEKKEPVVEPKEEVKPEPAPQKEEKKEEHNIFDILDFSDF